MSSIVENHHRKLVDHMPPEQYKAYLLEFIAVYCLQNGSAGLCSRFPGLAPFYEDPPLGIQSEPWNFPHKVAAPVTLGSRSPFDHPEEAAK